MALHHKVCHVLGGPLDLAHAETHAAVLPPVLAHNAPAAPAALERVNRALRSSDAPFALFALTGCLGVPTSLRELGMPESGIAQAAGLVVQDAYWNPRPVDEAAVRALLTRAWAGEPPVPCPEATTPTPLLGSEPCLT